MTSRGSRRPAVIVGVDRVAEGRRALHWAAAEAGRRRLPVRVLHAVDIAHAELAKTVGSDSSETPDLGAAQKVVDAAVAEIERTWPEVPATGQWVAGPPWAVLVRSATPDDLIVVGSHGRGRLGTALVGSVSAEVAQRAPCPVVVVREARPRRYPETRRGVVVGIDGSDASVEATGFAFAAASARGLPLTVVHAVWDPYQESHAVVSLLSETERVSVAEQERLDVAETIAGWREQYPDVPVVVRYENGRAAKVLADVADGADLLVVGAHGRGTTAALLLGSVSRGLLKQSRCPVAVVRHKARRRDRLASAEAPEGATGG